MSKRLPVLFLIVGIALALGACSGQATQPLSFRPAPWQPGETSRYDLLDRSGNRVGSAVWTWERSGNEWQQQYTVTVNNVPDTGAVFLSDDFESLRSWREVGGKRYETTYGDKSIGVRTTAADGSVTTKTLPAVPDAIDNDVSLQLQRALPLDEGYATRYTDIIPTTGGTAPILLSVTAAETITVPAGAFPTWRVKMAVGSIAHEAWYAQEPPYRMVKYLNSASGASFVLTNAGQAAIATAQAAPAAGTGAPAQDGEPAPLPPINWALLAVMAGIQLPVLIGLPILLGWLIKRRYGIGWGVFGWGMLSFVLSQVIHIPLNLALGLLGAPARGVGLWPAIPLGLAVGLSAAVCEEGARLLVITLFAKKIRGWAPGLQFGAGHGGMESILLGLLVAVNLAAILASRGLGPVAQMLPPEAVAQLRTAQEAFWSQNALMPFVSILERVFALMLQVALAVLVVQSVTYRQPLYFVAALVLHTLVDAWVIWAQPLGIAGIEAGVAVVGLFSLWIIWRLREQPAPPGPVLTSGTSSGPVPSATDLSERQLSPEELARRAERSRYE